MCLLSILQPFQSKQNFHLLSQICNTDISNSLLTKDTSFSCGSSSIICPCLSLSSPLHFWVRHWILIASSFSQKMQGIPIGIKIVSGYLPIFILLLIIHSSVAQPKVKNGLKTQVFQFHKIEMEPGSISNKYYYNVDFPRGHMAIKNFNAEVVDEKGNSVPLHETYLHHWLMLRYYQRKGGLDIPEQNDDMGVLQPDHIYVLNSGVCERLPQYFGIGSETRGTKTDIPDPYGIEVGNPDDVPDGYEERWMLNVHAIDTRGAEDKLGCAECRCDSYNVSNMNGYSGGLGCCHEGLRCRLKQGFEGVKRGIYLRYTVKYVEWDTSIVPVKVYILDVMDTWTKANDQSRGPNARHHCLREYDVEACPTGVARDECTDKKSVTIRFPTGGDVIYGVGHQHAGGIGTALYGEGGREICVSNPIYGNGDEAGNEAGHIVGMPTCYPSPGSVKISAGEMLTLVSTYNSSEKHVGVMGLFYLLIADHHPVSNPNNATTFHTSIDAHYNNVMTTTSNLGWSVALLGVGAAVIAVAAVVFYRRTGRGEGYKTITP